MPDERDDPDSATPDRPVDTATPTRRGIPSSGSAAVASDLLAGCDADGDRSEPGSSATTVRRSRELVEGLAVPDGEYAVACKDSGIQPDPVATTTFDAYEDAERAADAASRYRAAMRELDPSLPEYDLVVAEARDSSVELTSVRESTTERRHNGLPRTRRTATLAGDRRDEWLVVENAPVVHLAGPESLLDDEFVTRQLRSKL